MIIIKYRKIFYALSIILLTISVYAIFGLGLKQGTDFSGGSLLDISFENNIPTLEAVNQKVHEVGFVNASVRRVGENGFSIKLKEINQEEKTTIINSIGSLGSIPTEKSFTSIGPVLGKESLQKSMISIVLVLLAIVFFIAFAFRKVSRPISSWVYGFVAIVALLHDVLIPAGVFAIFGNLYGFEIDTLFVTALLVILGFSVHDTIVVFDRVRENLKNTSGIKNNEQFEQVVGRSINETFVRSINTSLTTILAIIALYIWGPESVHHFALTLLIGISVGTYSSIFIGSPLLVTINNWKKGN